MSSWELRCNIPVSLFFSNEYWRIIFPFQKYKYYLKAIVLYSFEMTDEI